MANPADISVKAEAMAALAICESLLLALSDLKIIETKDAADVLRDAAAAHRNVDGAPEVVGLHRQVASIIDGMTPGLSVAPRRPDRLP